MDGITFSGGTMKKIVMVSVVSALLLGSCAIGVGRHGGLVIEPTLPMSVELDADNYYYDNGYYYYYQGNDWTYSESRHGPWMRLPRDRYPREVHYRGQENHQDHHDYGDRDKEK
jgi:hypothetical protein